MKKSFHIKNCSLPSNWIRKINNFNIEDYDKNTKSFIDKLILEIKHCQDNALSDFVIQSYVKYICCNEKLLFDYKTIPNKLMTQVMNEIKPQKIYKFSEKLLSSITELTTYKIFKRKGFVYVGQSSKEDYTDLIMLKNNKNYDIQIKYKQSPQTLLVFIENYIKGKALLHNNTFLRDKEITVLLKKDGIDRDERKQIFEIILPDFIKQQKHSYNSDLLQIIIKGNKNRDYETVTKDLEETLIQELPMFQIQKYIKSGFLSYPIKELEKQYLKRNQNNKFIGVIVLDRDFYRTFTIENIKSAFKNSWDKKFDLLVVVQDSFMYETDVLIKANFLEIGETISNPEIEEREKKTPNITMDEDEIPFRKY